MTKSLALLSLAFAASLPAAARDATVTITLESVLAMPAAKAKLDGSVKFYLAGASPRDGKRFGEAMANVKTNAFNKTPEEACRWAALDALIKLESHARREGAVAIVDIVSYNQQQAFSSPANVQCVEGTFLGGIALKGAYVKSGK